MRAVKGFTAYPLLSLSLSFVAGTWLASVWGMPAARWLWLFLGVLLLLLIGSILANKLRWQNSDPLRAARLALACLGVLSLGAARYQAAQPAFAPGDLAWYNDLDEPLEITAVVVKPPDVRDTYQQVRLRAESISADSWEEARPVDGMLLAYLPRTSTWHYGDRLRLYGALLTPSESEDFSYKAYLARQQVYSLMPFASASLLESGQGNPVVAAIFSFKANALKLVYRFLPDPEASLVAGIVLGVESGIPEDVKNDFRDTGTSHIIAISGFNITIVAGLFAMLFGRALGPRRGALAALLAIAVYTLMVGGDAPVVRAAIMGGLSLFARQVGRRQHGLNSLAFTAALMSAANPNILWDVGFQLSFTATLGLVLYAEPWSKAFEGWLGRWVSAPKARQITAPISEYFLLTLAAQLTTLPVILYHFERLSLISLPANIAILPAQPPVMILGGLSVLLGSLAPFLGQGIAYLVWPFIAYTIRMVAWLAAFDQSVLVLSKVPLWFVAAYYLLMLALTVLWPRLRQRGFPNLKPAVLLSGLAVLVVLVWQAALSVPDSRLHVHLLDVGAGEGLLIQTPGGRYVLVGGGESAVRLSDALGRRLPLFHRRLDMLVAASGQTDALSGLAAVLERFTPASVWWAGEPQASRDGQTVYTWLVAADVPLSRLQSGQALDLGDGVTLEALYVDDKGTLMLLRWEKFRLLLPLGMREGAPAAAQASAAMPTGGILLLADSGAIEANPPQWISDRSPELVLLSLATPNNRSLPDPETLDALGGIPLLRTDLNGSIELISDGQQLWVEVERP